MLKSKNFSLYFLIIIFLSIYLGIEDVFAQTSETIKNNLEVAETHFRNGEYKQAIIIYDEILEVNSQDTKTLNLKGVALSNLGYDVKSLKVFFEVLQNDPNNTTALTGIGLGLGNLGEYQEALIYFEKAEEVKPNSIVLRNYIEFLEKTMKKYPNKPTEKPTGDRVMDNGSVPSWIKETATWWAIGKVSDQDFLNILQFMINHNIIQIPNDKVFENSKELKMLSLIRSNLDLWGNEITSNEEFYKNMNWLKHNKFIDINKPIQKSEEELEYERYWFQRYLLDISSNISKEKRFIEFPNPSSDVIKKFLRDYAKWNFETQVESSSTDYPDPTYEVVDEIYIITYKIYINSQPDGLPLNHITTLENTFSFWESQESKTNNQNAVVKFEITKKKQEANVWITWVVRNMGEGVLGHAHLGKGVVEVSLGDYGCDGSFQLYDKRSVETIMTHEVGHSIGLHHTNDRTNIMYPSYTPTYAYCLLE